MPRVKSFRAAPTLRYLALVIGCAVLFASGPLRADDIALAGQPYTGRLQFVFVGASLVRPAPGTTNGVDCLYKSASAVVRASDLPERPRVRSAFLYVGGSLFGDDGPDYPGIEIFDTDGISGEADPAFVTQRAREAADTSVSLLLPGRVTPVTIQARTTPAVTTFFKSEGTEEGNIAFFMSRFDVTDLVATNGGLDGAYTVSDVTADICLGTEAVCEDGQTCTTQPPPGSGRPQGTHTNAAASWALMLVLEDDALPLRTIGLFEGLEQVSGTRNSITLDTVNPISNPAAGRLAFYALEGDLLLANNDPSKLPCGADEFIQVNGSISGSGPGLCLSDDDNPIGNIFNSTINSEPRRPDGPTCTTPDTLTCCGGDGLCGVTGVDIDRFNISQALEPNARRVSVTYGTASDRIALAVMALEVDVFQPSLIADTQIRPLSAVNGKVQVGGELLYSIAISNTGNVPATGVRVQMSAPPRVQGFEVLSVPEGSTNLSISGGGGDNNTGRVFVQDFDVPAGQIREIRARMITACDALATELKPVAAVSSAEIPAFNVAAIPVNVNGPGTGACDGLDPNGSFGDDPDFGPQRVLRGGGGCSAEAAVPLTAIATALALLMLVRRRGGAR